MTPDTRTGAAAAMYLARLERLLRLRAVYALEVNEQGATLLTRAVTATIGDCMDLGAGEQAGEVLKAVGR